MKECCSADEILLLVELSAPMADGFLQLLDGLETPIGDGLSNKRPEAFAGLNLWAIRRLKHQMDALGNHKTSPRVAPCTNNTICLSGPTPTSSAKHFSDRFIIFVFIQGKISQTTRPLAG
jgi:hypothetical protein